MPRLFLTLLGTFQVAVDRTPITEFHSNKVRVLLSYLAVEADRPHERSHLATLLWPNLSSEHASTLLRQALHRLGQVLQTAQQSHPPLLVTRQSVQFNPAVDYLLDVTQFTTLIAMAASHRHRRLDGCQSCIEKLRQAVTLYRGEFLAGFSDMDALPFQEWLLIWRARLSHQFARALDQLASYHAQQGEHDQAIADLRRWLEIEPWREETHRQLMVLLARSGERSAALVQFEQCRQALAADLHMTPTAETVALYRRIQYGALGDGSSLGIAPSAPHAGHALPADLPAQIGPLIGRARELAQIGERLVDVDCRLLTLVGPGGSGKTWLAIAAATAARSAFRDGVIFISLAAVPAVDHIAAELLRGVGLPEDSAEEQLSSYLQGKEILLVLDSFEHLVAGADLLTRLLRAVRGLTLLVTSRIPLSLEPEWLFSVAGLATPPDRRIDGEPVILEDYPATQLFLHIARKVRPDFAPDAEQRQAIACVCQVVAGLPLAIRLAAAGVDRYQPSAIVALLRQDFDLLTSNMRDTPERHRSMRAVFAGSWQLLITEEQRLLAYCAVFAGAFSSNAVVAVCEPRSILNERSVGKREPGQLRSSIISLLETLVSKSLVQRIDVGRYELLALVRHYAAERLEATFDAIAVRTRHSRFYLGLLAYHADLATSPTIGEAAVLLDSELDNIRTAWRWAVAQADLPAIEKSLKALADFSVLRGMYEEGDRMFETCAARLRGLIDAETPAGSARRVLGALLIERARMRRALLDHAPAHQKLMRR